MTNQYDTTLSFNLKKPWPNQDFDIWGDHLNQNADAIDALLLDLNNRVGSAGGGGPFLLLSGGIMGGSVTLTGMSCAWNPATENPFPIPGYVFSSRYGQQSAFDIFSKVLSTPPNGLRNTFNVLEGVLTLPATVTDFNTYHTAVSGFVSNQSTKGVGFAVGGYAVGEADGTVVGAFGSVNVDSPRDPVTHKPSGQYIGVRMQNEQDWYTGNATTSVRATLHDGYFTVAPNGSKNFVAFQNNIFVGPWFIANGVTYNGSVMTVPPGGVVAGGLPPGSVGPPVIAVGMHLEGSGIDSSLNITVGSFGTGIGQDGTYNLIDATGAPYNVILPASITTATVRGTSSYQWNTTVVSPDGVAIAALDVGQRNFAASLTVGDRSQFVNWRFTDMSTVTADERVMQQRVEPMSMDAPWNGQGGALYLENYLQHLAPASYAVQNYSWNRSAFLAKNNAQTGWVDALHVDGNDRVVLGAGSNGITEIATSQGVHVEIIDSGVPPVNSVGMKAATASTTGHIYMVGGSNLQLSNASLASTATTGFVSPFPVINGRPTSIPLCQDGTTVAANGSNALGAWNSADKAIDIFDSASSTWYALRGAVAGTGGLWNAGTVNAIGPNLVNASGTLMFANSTSISGTATAATLVANSASITSSVTAGAATISGLVQAGTVQATGSVIANTASISGVAAAGTMLVNTGTPVASEILSVNGGFNIGGTVGAGGTVNVTMGANMSVVNGGLLPGQFPPTAGSTAHWVVGSGLTRIMIEGVGNAPALTMRGSRGAPGAVTGLTANSGLGSVLGMGYDGTVYTGAQAGLYMNAINNWTTADHSSYFDFQATKSGATAISSHMRLTNGHCLVSTTTDDGINTLQVNGAATATFHAESVSNNLTLTGTNQAGALALTKGLNLFGTVPASSGASLPVIGTTVAAGAWVECFNTTATAARIYGGGTQTIDGVATATGVPLSANARCRYFANTGSTWVSALMGGVSA